MSKKNNEALNGFSGVFNSLSSSKDSYFDSEEEFDMDDKIYELPDDDDDEDDDEDVDDSGNGLKKDKITEDDKSDDGVGDDSSATDDDNDQFSLLFKAIAEAGGIDVSDEALPKSAEELVGYVNAIIEDKSAPKYASDEVRALDEFVRNGGDINDYIYTSVGLDVENVDMSNEYMQRQVIKEFMSKKGFSEQQIQKKIEKYESADILEDEANDALESLKEIVSEERKSLLEEQKIYKEQAEAEQQRFYNSVVSEIEGLEDVRGIKIPKEDKKALRDYILNIESDGKTKYQKDWSKSVKNLIDSAYFTMKGDSLIKTAKKSGESTAIEKFKNSLKSSRVPMSKQTINEGGVTPLWDLVSKQLR